MKVCWGCLMYYSHACRFCVRFSKARRAFRLLNKTPFPYQVQEQNQSLRDALEKETNKPVAASSATAEMIDFKKMFAETKAHSRAIDMELRQCEVEEAR